MTNLRRLAVGAAAVALVACSQNNSPTVTVPTAPSSIPQITPSTNAQFASLCADLGQLEQVVAGMVTGSVAPSMGIQQIGDIGDRLRTDAQQIKASQPAVSATIEDLSNAADELRSALSNGGSVASVIASNVPRLNADIAKIPSNVCGSTPSPIPT
jgi:uncharacterized phage infection (PIP) family protein YhgE